jgi:hypothetical protein
MEDMDELPFAFSKAVDRTEVQAFLDNSPPHPMIQKLATFSKGCVFKFQRYSNQFITMR